MLANAASLAFATDMHANKHAKLQRGEKLVPLCMHDVKQGMDTILVAETLFCNASNHKSHTSCYIITVAIEF